MKLFLSGLGLLLTCCVASANPYLPVGYAAPACPSCGPAMPYHGGYMPAMPYHAGPAPCVGYPMPYQCANPYYSLGPGGLPFNGILPPTPWGQQQQPMGPAFGTHPYARSPRDYFMISDIQEDLERRGY